MEATETLKTPQQLIAEQPGVDPWLRWLMAPKCRHGLKAGYDPKCWDCVIYGPNGMTHEWNAQVREKKLANSRPETPRP